MNFSFKSVSFAAVMRENKKGQFLKHSVDIIRIYCLSYQITYSKETF